MIGKIPQVLANLYAIATTDLTVLDSVLGDKKQTELNKFYKWLEKNGYGQTEYVGVFVGNIDTITQGVDTSPSEDYYIVNLLKEYWRIYQFGAGKGKAFALISTNGLTQSAVNETLANTPITKQIELFVADAEFYKAKCDELLADNAKLHQEIDQLSKSISSQTQMTWF